MNYVIGSGPAGVAAATALVERGVPVTMLDAGGDLESGAATAAARLADREPPQWTDEDRTTIRGPLRFNSEGAPLKLAYGSDYVYRDVEQWQPVHATGVEAYRGFAAGGLSSLWGAAILPFAERDLDGWPLSLPDLESGYRRALALTGLAGEHDGLASTYPLYVSPTMTAPLSTQAQAIVTRLEHHERSLAKEGLTFGRARLALTPSDSSATTSCQRCGMCLYGCPWGLIYTAAMTVRRLMAKTHGFRYAPGIVVRRLVEHAEGVTIHGTSRHTRGDLRFEASRVYLAAGAIASTAIVLASVPTLERVLLRQSEHFLVPLLLRQSAHRPPDERLHTLSQIFVELDTPSPGARPAHLQVYTHNDFYERMARAKLGPLYSAVAPLAKHAIDRLVLIKGYLHSNDSRAIEAALDADDETTRLRLAPKAQPAAMSTVRAVVRRLRRDGKRMGVWPVPGAWRLGLPGSSVHVGGSFPMSHRPTGAASDILGRPAGLSRVHVVDASVFPTMPAVPPTLTVMANAFRIADASRAAGTA